ncbi:hypothetical protein FO519_005769 [Halicephalobus sp. NKZ332]|nr:hypothetical protein FO519_005769 [Halicephalobus sp. NKZ332]
MDKSQKAVEALKGLLENTSPKKSVSSKSVYEGYFSDIYSALTSSEHISKADFLAAVDVLFFAAGSSISSIQIQADHTLNKTFRVFWLKGQVQKVISLLLNELNSAGTRPWKSVSGAFTKLAYYIQFARSPKSSVYLLHFLNSVGLCINRPEDGIQTCLEKTFPVIMKQLRDYLNDQATFKEDELFSLAIKNRELPGSSGRTAAVIVSELAKSSHRNLEKAVRVVCKTLNEEGAESNKRLVVNTLLILRFIWTEITESYSKLSSANLQNALIQILKLVLSPSNEILIASLEVIEVVFSTPNPLIRFTPSEMPLPSHASSEFSSPLKTPKAMNNEALLEQLEHQFDLLGSPWGSINDVSIGAPSYDTPRNEEGEDSTSEVISEEKFEDANESFVDPLVNTTADSVSLLDATIDDSSNKEQLLFDAKNEPFLVLVATAVVRRFLAKRIGCDDDSRISHKVLAFKCLNAILSSTMSMVDEIPSIIGDTELLNEMFNYVSHSDDKLAIAAFKFYLAIQAAKYENGHRINFIQFGAHIHQMLNGINPMRIRGAVEALKQVLYLVFLNDRLCAILFDYLMNLDWCTYFLTQCSRLELLGAIEWRSVSSQVRSQFQYSCLVSIIDELGNEDGRIKTGAASAFSSFTQKMFLDFCPPLSFNVPQFLDFSSLMLKRSDKDININIDHRMEQNVAFSLEVLSYRTIDLKNKSEDKLIPFITGLNALMKDLGIQSVLNLWFGHPSLSNFQYSLILTLLESSTSNISGDDLVTVMNVLSVFYSYLEPTAKKNSSLNSQQLSITDGKLETRVAIVYLRVLNLYYTVFVENKVQEENAPLSSVFAPESPLKQTENRSSDISHLVGTGVHQMKSANYNECHVLRSLESVVRGSYKNFMETLDLDAQSRFLDPLITAFHGLRRILSTFTYNEVNPFLDELMLYLNRLMPFAIAPATGVLCELLKVIFGRNSKYSRNNIKSIIRRSPSMTKEEKYRIGSGFEDFAYYLAKVSSGIVEETLLMNYALMYSKNDKKRDRLTFETVTNALKRFEKSSAYLVSITFTSTSCPEIRSKILDFLCILLLEGVEYKLADPKRRIFDYAVAAVKNPQPENLPIFPNLLNFLIVLSTVDSSYSKPADLEQVIVSIINKVKEEDSKTIFPCVALFLVYNMSLNVKSIALLQKTMSSKFQSWMIIDAVTVFQLWTLLLCCSKKDKDKSLCDEVSADFVGNYYFFCKNVENEGIFKWTPEALIWATNVFFTCSPNIFMPIDQVFNFLMEVGENFDIIPILGTFPIMALISQMEEERVLLRAQALTEEPLEKLGKTVIQCLSKIVDRFCQEKDLLESDSKIHRYYVSFGSKLVLYYIKAGNRIGNYVQNNISKFLDSSLVEKSRNRLSSVFIYLVIVMIQSRDPSVLNLVNTKKSHSAEERNFLIHLVIDILKNETVRSMFDDQQLLQLIDSNDVGIHLMRMSLPVYSLKRLPNPCYSKLVQQQHDFIVSSKLNEFIQLFSQNLLYCSKNEVDLPEQLKRIAVSIDEDGELSSSLAIQKTLHSMEINKVDDGISKSSFAATVIGRAMEAKTVEDAHEISSMVFLLEPEELIQIICSLPENLRTSFFYNLFSLLRRTIIDAVGINFTEDDKETIKNTQNAIDNLFIAAISKSKLPAFDRHHLLSGVFELVQEPFRLNSSLISDPEEIFTVLFVEPLVEHSLQNKHLQEVYFSALITFFSIDRTIEVFSPDYDCLEILRQYLPLLTKTVERMANKVDQAKTKSWSIQVSSVSKSEAYKDEILDLFLSVQKISLLIQTDNFHQMSFSESIENAFKAILRLPLLSAMFVIPEVALKQNWALNIDARSDRIFIPLVNIYILEDPVVLKDFSFRTLWLGWTNRCQFENYCTSLFGVLSATPVGNELHTADSEETLHNSINAVSVAVETITNLLMQSLLYPVPGNPVHGFYLTKYRESQDHGPFLGSYRGKQAASVKCQLFRSFNIKMIFKESFEKIVEENEYGIGQSSLLYLWSMTGILERSNVTPQKSPKKNVNIPQSISEYMLLQTTDLDTASTLKALLDNFDHWFSKAEMPMTLKIAVYKSLIVLTDLVDDTRVHMKNLEETRRHISGISVAENSVDGLAIFLFLKSVAILGTDSLFVDETAADTNKFVESTIIMGVQSENAIVRQYTLQGILYILQSYLLDDLPNSFFVIKELILDELSKLSMASDVVTNCDLVPFHYEQILWATAFRCLEEPLPLDDGYKIDFVSLVKKLYGDPRLSCSQKQVLTSGIESLILHSATYNAQLLPVILDCLSTCQLQPLHIRCSISSFIVCIFKDLHKLDDSKHEFSKIVDFNRLINIIAAFSSSGVIEDLVEVIGSILTLTTSLNQLVENLAMLITTPPSRKDTPLLTAFDSALLHLYGKTMVACRKESKSFAAELVIKEIAPRVAVVQDDEYASFLTGLTLISVCQEKQTPLWISTFISMFNSNRDLRGITRQLPNLMRDFAGMVNSEFERHRESSGTLLVEDRRPSELPKGRVTCIDFYGLTPTT